MEKGQKDLSAINISTINFSKGITMASIKDTLTTAAAEAIVDENTGKKWYASKTVWLNVIAAAAMFAQMKWGFIIDPSTQALALSGINLVLRKVTKQAIEF